MTEEFGLPVVTSSDERVVDLYGETDWLKIAGQRWYSLYHMHRLVNVD